MTRGDHNRNFHYAVLASLALHAVLLLGFPDLISTARRAVESFTPPIVARLIAPEPASAPPAVEEKKPPPPLPPRQAQKPVPPKAVVKPAPIAKPIPAPELEPAPAAAEPHPAPPAPAAPVEAPAAPAIAETAPPGAPVGAPPAAAPREARTIGEYRLELIEAARRIKDRTRYPPVARDNNWTGQTQVRVALAASGAPAISVKGTSGHQVLDQHALAIFRQAAREVALPEDLRGKEFAVEVWMDFTLTP